MQVEVVPLGAGQDVGRSCVLVTLGGKRIMFDCGIHMGYTDTRRFPDFRYISRSGRYTQAIDAVIITHFHLDHCGALPYFTEVQGYRGPVFMTYPTKALVPLMLEDFRKVVVDRLGEAEHFSATHIKSCMRKVTAVDLMQTYKVDDELEIRAYYAGHVLGAAMFYAKVGDEVFGPSVLYTGDYNMTPDRHLGAARVERCRPDVLITESTYATTIRDSKRSRERDFLQQVHECITAGGKVLIPVFALGRAQELAILIEEYWERTGLTVPVYFSAGLTSKANVYYKLLVSWTNQVVKDMHQKHNVFDFRHVQPFDRSYIEKPGPCVLFASPGMLHTGMSLDVFKQWCHVERNMVILPGYCVPGTVGNKLIAGHRGPLQIDQRCTVDVQCKVAHLSFSAHADAKGIMQMIREAAPRNVLLVHGEASKMEFLKAKIIRTLGVPCYNPANMETVAIPTGGSVRVDVSKDLVKQALQEHIRRDEDAPPAPCDSLPVEGILVAKGGTQGVGFQADLVGVAEAHTALGVQPHALTLSCRLRCCAPASFLAPKQAQGADPASKRQRKEETLSPVDEAVQNALNTVRTQMQQWFGHSVEAEQSPNTFTARSFEAKPISDIDGADIEDKASDGDTSEKPNAHVIELSCTWQYEDDPLAHRVLSMLERQIET
mmetsp:Transcript_4763/g.9038  ORF Transcript_4763/g.9038 Transcript_4763/m.9038 type:complete len:660 (-) Transcript_4763:272-2251(-)